MATSPLNLAELEPVALEKTLAELGAPAFHGRQIFAWIHRRGVTRFEAMTDLPAGLRQALAERFAIYTPQLERVDQSTDGTTKFLLRLADDRRIESVYIPDTPAQTFCISTQVGCAMGCAFCLTGKMGLVRNLTAGEIVGQVRVLAHHTGLAGIAFNIVLMGMGEPLHNYDAVMQALAVVSDPHGFGISPTRITVNTVGLVPGILRMAAERRPYSLGVSLHGSTEAERAALVPVSRRWPLADVLDACRAYCAETGRRIFFAWTLIDGVNDSPAHASRLAAQLVGIDAHVNLIELNPTPGYAGRGASRPAAETFRRVIQDAGIPCTIRQRRGVDVAAGCGQLRAERQPPARTAQVMR